MEDKDILDFFNKEDLLFNFGYHSDPIKSPFEIDSKEFIKFAEEDLNENTKKGLINSLSNIKRAIDCRIESLLYFLGIYNKSKKEDWSFPTKIKFMCEINVIAPRILEKINKKRNELEHEFKIPSKEEVEDFLDVANLFLLYTNKFVSKKGLSLDEVFINSDKEGDYWYYPCGGIILDYEKGIIDVNFTEKKELSPKKISISISDYEDYKTIIKIWIRAINQAF